MSRSHNFQNMQNHLNMRDDRSEGRSHIANPNYDGETIVEEGVSERFTPSHNDSDEERDKVGGFFQHSRVINHGNTPPPVNQFQGLGSEKRGKHG